jgi:hypothetical protein
MGVATMPLPSSKRDDAGFERLRPTFVHSGEWYSLMRNAVFERVYNAS